MKRLLQQAMVVSFLLPTMTAANNKAFLFRRQRHHIPFHLHNIIMRGGGGSLQDSSSDAYNNNDKEEIISQDDETSRVEQEVVLDASVVLTAESQETESAPSSSTTLKRRRTSEIILNLIDDSPVGGGDKELSDSLRLLMMERRDELLASLEQKQQQNNDEQRQAKEHHHQGANTAMVKRLLHFLAPKIPAIRQSPDVSLAIRALPSDLDAGLAASLVATLAHLWEMQHLLSIHHGSPSSNNSNNNDTVATDLVHDRRFGQLIETILCGVNIAKRKVEASTLHHVQQHDDLWGDLVHLIQHAQVDEGLSIRDSCRAAWGIAMLGLHGNIGETSVHDILVALALRTRELLLGRVRLLCQDDFYVESNNSTIPIEERIMGIAQEIAEDTATALWVFGCVQAVTGIKSTPLVHVCSSILCHDPFQLRKNVQEAIATFDEPVVGGSDVIEKLDRAERTEEEIAIPEAKRSQDVFLDWLSPTEVTDVLWALAVYTEKDPGSMKSIDVLSDIAVDRVVEWLAKDLQHGELDNEADEQIGHFSSKESELAESRHITDGEREINTDIQSWNEKPRDVEYVEVADAAAILASENTVIDRKPENIHTSDIEAISHIDETSLVLDADKNLQVVDAAVLLDADEALVNEVPSSRQSESDPIQTYLSKKDKIDWLFSAHDLCSLSWAVTELGDSLKSRATQMVSDLLVLMGPKHVATCSSADYSSLIWAIAKESSEQSSASSPNFVTLGRWIAENLFQSTGLADAVIESDSWTLLDQFQPPELSRLLWSLATLSRTAEDSRLSNLVGVLSLAGLETASRNFPLFSSEDLARICWAFVEFSDYNAVLKTNPSSLLSLGRVLGIIDMALTNWETGNLSGQPPKGEEEIEYSKEAFRFTSFFGRGRSHISKFERKIEEMADDLDDYPVPSLLVEKARLPFLKDFPVDPATLCKLCGSLSQPGSPYSKICDTHMMTKVIVRLMTSRNGRLLRECHVNDLASVCIAAVAVTSSSNRELMGLFARRAVNVINDNPSLLEVARPSIFAKLLCALGDLGSKYHPEGDSENAHRRLHLTARLPFPNDSAFDKLSHESLLDLMRGLARINATSEEENIVAKTLAELDRRFSKMKERIRLDEFLSTVVFFLPPNQMFGNFTETNRTREVIDLRGDTGTIRTVHLHTASLLRQIADAAVEKIRVLRSSELRRILHHFVALPFPVDDLVSAAEDEIDRRKAALDESTLASASLKSAIEKIPQDMWKQIIDGSKGHPSNRVKNLLRSLIRDQNEKRHDEGSPIDGNDGSADTQHPSLENILQIIFATTEVRDSLVDFPIDQSDRVEFGRIQELISQYHRIDFESGSRESRFNNQGRRLMAKRMMSRLLP